MRAEANPYDPTLHGAWAFRFGMDPGVALTGYAALTAWYLGYPDHALTRARDTWTLAQDLSHPPSQASGALLLSWVHFLRQEPALAQERIESAITLSTRAEEVMLLAMGTMFKGAALAEQGHTEDGLALLQQGWSALQAIGSRMYELEFSAHDGASVWRNGTGRGRTCRSCRGGGVHSGERGALGRGGAVSAERGADAATSLSSKFRVQSSSTQHPSPTHEAEAEACFLKAIDIARQQQAKSWNCAPQRAWRDCGNSKANNTKHADVSRDLQLVHRRV